MKTQHTKGPWMDKEGQIYPEATGKTLALIPYFDKSNEEEKANARLIAAAPELLEALTNALPYVQSTLDTLNQIANENNTEDSDQAKDAMALIDNIEEAINKAIEG